MSYSLAPVLIKKLCCARPFPPLAPSWKTKHHHLSLWKLSSVTSRARGESLRSCASWKFNFKSCRLWMSIPLLLQTGSTFPSWLCWVVWGSLDPCLWNLISQNSTEDLIVEDSPSPTSQTISNLLMQLKVILRSFLKIGNYSDKPTQIGPFNLFFTLSCAVGQHLNF